MNTVIDTAACAEEMRTAAREAALARIEQYGEQWYCGFAWVTVHPQHKGNTRAGKAERRVLEAMGLRKDWTGKAYELWNPSGLGTQCMSTKEAGADAAAAVLQRYGFTASANSRAD
jgi:hypothetical protein